MCGKLLLSIYQYLIKKFTKGYGLSNYRPIKAIMKNAEKKIKTDFAYVQGSKMFLDPTDSLRLSIDGVYGILDTETIKNQISKNEITIDVGANIGYYTLLFSKLVGSNGKVFAFEPEHNNYCLLKKNITALFCADDIMAFGCLDYIKENTKLNIPKEIEIIGYDDISTAHWHSYNLTTIRQPIRQMSKLVTQIIDDNIKDPEFEPINHVIQGKFIYRNTTR